MKLYLSHTSPYARLALISAWRAGKMDMQLQFVQPWDNPETLLAVNPFSQVPTLLCDDGNVITDSLIIVHYLDPMTLTGGTNSAVMGFAMTVINQAVKAFSLQKFAPANGIAHPHIARAESALRRALPSAPVLLPASEQWAQIVLGNALNYVRMRLPAIYDAAVSHDNKRSVNIFLERDFMLRTETSALQKNPATVGEL